MKNGQRTTKLFKRHSFTPLNDFSAVQTDKKMGVIDIEDGKKYHIRIEASDYAGNKSQINFDLLGVKATANISKQTFKSNFSYLINKNTVFKTEERILK